MNKTSAVVRIVIWSLIALILTGLMLGIMVMGGLSNLLDGISFGLNKYNYDNASEYSVGNTDISENISDIEIHWVNGSINVEKYDGKTVSVKETGANESDDELRYLVKNGRLIIQFRKSGILFDNKKLEKHLTVMIPEDTANGMTGFEIESVSASIDISDLKIAQTLDIENVSGKVTLKNIQVNKLDVDTVSGNIAFNGNLKELDSDGVSANTNITTDTMPSKVDFDTVSGDITLSIPENTGFTVNFDKVSGSFSCSFSTKNHDGKYIYGDGSADIDVNSVSGDITIQQTETTEA